MLDSCLVFLFAISPPASQVQTLTGKYAHSIWERPILRRVFCELSTESLSICLYTYMCAAERVAVFIQIRCLHTIPNPNP